MVCSLEILVSFLKFKIVKFGFRYIGDIEKLRLSFELYLRV